MGSGQVECLSVSRWGEVPEESVGAWREDGETMDSQFSELGREALEPERHKTGVRFPGKGTIVPR